tara:strand:- start:1947 stop:2090 length:144 start_codon:yes stop_codon:yes gene_type:complete
LDDAQLMADAHIVDPVMYGGIMHLRGGLKDESMSNAALHSEFGDELF